MAQYHVTQAWKSKAECTWSATYSKLLPGTTVTQLALVSKPQAQLQLIPGHEILVKHSLVVELWRLAGPISEESIQSVTFHPVLQQLRFINYQPEPVSISMKIKLSLG